MSKLILPALVAAFLVGLTGCMTEATHNIAAGERTEDTSRLSEKDIKTVVSAVIDKVLEKAKRYKPADGTKYVINVKKTKVDTTSRGSQANYLAENIPAFLEEELTDRDVFYIYDEAMAVQNANAGRAPIPPQFVLFSTLMEQNVRRDNGNIYREYALLVKLIDASTSASIFQKRVPLQKGVDKSRIMD